MPVELAADFPPLAEGAGVEQVLERIGAAGIVGMGGGGYPTARKIRQAIESKVEWVIGNGMASEPGATADVALLEQHGDAVAAGLELVARCVGAAHAVLAVPPGSDANVGTPVDLEYPAGDEKRLVKHLTGRAVPDDGFPTDIRVLVLNVATLFAIHAAVACGCGLRQRLVTVAGTDRWLAIGTPLAALGLPHPASGFRVCGDLTGRDVPADAVLDASMFSVDARRQPGWACIRCGWCTQACPEGLKPADLHRAYDAGLGDPTVFDCIDCGACTAACPSQLDLVNEFRAIRVRMAGERSAAARAALARQRSAARAARLARASEQREQERVERMQKPRQW